MTRPRSCTSVKIGKLADGLNAVLQVMDQRRMNDHQNCCSDYCKWTTCAVNLRDPTRLEVGLDDLGGRPPTPLSRRVGSLHFNASWVLLPGAVFTAQTRIGERNVHIILSTGAHRDGMTQRWNDTNVYKFTLQSRRKSVRWGHGTRLGQKPRQRPQ